MHGTEADVAMDGIAIIGMAVRLPGASDVDQFWRNQIAGIGAIRRLDDDALLAAGFSPSDLTDPALVRAYGVLDDVGRFDASFFGISPREATRMAPRSNSSTVSRTATAWKGSLSFSRSAQAAVTRLSRSSRFASSVIAIGQSLPSQPGVAWMCSMLDIQAA